MENAKGDSTETWNLRHASRLPVEWGSSCYVSLEALDQKSVQLAIVHTVRRRATVLLVAFLLGGTVSPSAHLVHHGLRLASHYSGDCDHTHSGWHPDFEFLTEDDCLLCRRDVDEYQIGPRNSEVWTVVTRIVSVPPIAAVHSVLTQRPIRAPPAAKTVNSEHAHSWPPPGILALSTA